MQYNLMEKKPWMDVTIKDHFVDIKKKKYMDLK